MTTERTTIDVADVRFVASDDGAVEGVAVAFGVVDSYGTSFDRRAFADVRGPLPALWSHDPSEVVGSWSSITLGDDGLRVVGRLNLDVAKAREVRALLANGDVSGLSIGFATESAETKPGGVRNITKAKLHEISFVAMPSVPGARVTSVRDASSSESEESTMPTENTEAPNGADVAALAETVAAIQSRLDDVEVRAARPSARVETTDGPSAELRAFRSYLRLGNQTPPDEIRTLTVSSDPQAGYLAPPEVTNEFTRNLVEYSPLRALASVRTTSAPSVRYPRRDSITNAQWEGELEESQESDISFGMNEVIVHKMMTFVDLSNELLADSAGAAEAEVRVALAEDFGQKEAVAFVSGSGVKQPEGLMSNADILHTVNGHATNLSADKLIDLLYSLPATYRNAPGAAWAMNGSTLAAVRKLKDGQNNYLWSPSYQAGQPEQILGKPVVEVLDMPDIGDGNYPIIYGDFSAYRIVDRSTMAILSDPYTQARRGVTRIHATRRVGGRVLQAARFRKLKTATS